MQKSPKRVPSQRVASPGSASASSRLVESIDKPLGFYVLALLIVEGFLTTIVVLSDLDAGAKTWAMWAVIGLFVLVVLIVTAFVWFKPTHLTFTGFETLVDRGKAAYGTETSEVFEVKEWPPGISDPE